MNLTPNGKPLQRNMNTRRNKTREHQARHHSEEVEGLLRDERNVAAYTGAAADSYAGTWDLGLRDRGLRKSAMIPDDETKHALPKRPKRNQQRHLGAGGVEHHPPRTS
ncbi:hypothetical protein IscW_ISCW009077 [Ixodes scapularis]|uniref:Uncharacterized protein n=1 Tax=Ixodes scapularis TaxID=6945 RepID=B7Q1H5_IXOSC|nr:hypothetical protein IscW_ISCW009077 [Ixodes scapularis]|eukprot:XP_002409629.1 hypothetical protein IscW_ISCW009077 [Ixodes scapularis]